MHLAFGLLAAFVLIALISWRRGPTRHCKWRADRGRNADRRFFYGCAVCGAELLCRSDTPPTRCAAGQSAEN